MRSLLIAAAATVCLFSPYAQAGLARDTLLDGARLCTRLLPSYEKQYRIPKHLLSAIAITESGRWHQRLGLPVPWPWTVNAEGQGHYFASKTEAIDFIRTLRKRGVASMDVGCMQVNLHHHPRAFASLQQAFDPQSNIRYAAQFLRGNYEEARSWKKAAAAYHSKTPERGNPYVQRVYRSWKQIVNHVKKRAGVRTAGDVTHSRGAPMGAFDVAALPSPAKPPRISQMKVIEISSRGVALGNDAATTTTEKGVKVTRASVAPPPAEEAPPSSLTDVAPLPEEAAPAEALEAEAVAEATPAASQAEAPERAFEPDAAPPSAAEAAAPTGPKVITIDRKTRTATVQHPAPRFIFD